MKSKKSIISYLILLSAVIILLNILTGYFTIRLDLTGDKRYTLSSSTKEILRSLTEPVTITAYFSGKLPPDVAKSRDNFQEMLIEYAKVSKGKIVYEFKNPNQSEEMEYEAMRQGINPVLINLREKDEVKQQKAFLGAVIQLGNQTEVIPFIKPGAALEYELSTAIKKLAVVDKPVIGILQGHGEPSLQAIFQARDQLSVLYNLEKVSLVDSINNLNLYKTVAIIAPKDSFKNWEIAQLEEFLANGNNLFLAINRVEANFQTAMGFPVFTGLEEWLDSKGISINENFIIDKNCNQISVVQQVGNMKFQTPVSFPYLPIISSFSEHPVTEGLEMVALQFASSIDFSGDTSMLRFEPLIYSSEGSGIEPAPLGFDINREWTESDFSLSYLTIGAVIEGKISRNAPKTCRMIVMSDGDFPVNGEGRDPQEINPDNISLLSNSIDWLSDETGLIALRTKGITARPLDEIDDAKKAFIKYLNFFLPLILVIGYGIFRMQYNRNLRIKRMEEGYV